MMQSFLRPPSWIAKSAALIAALRLFAIPLTSQAQVSIGFTIATAPPALPYYAQPMLSQPGEIWQPGYWAWGPAGYYWVPGTWVEPPYMGALWTPGYWGFYGGRYSFYPGYWGLHIGFYGGINYGF